jgi:hypothetical protein
MVSDINIVLADSVILKEDVLVVGINDLKGISLKINKILTSKYYPINFT